jgi:hypothetical protein
MMIVKDIGSVRIAGEIGGESGYFRIEYGQCGIDAMMETITSRYSPY